MKKRIGIVNGNPLYLRSYATFVEVYTSGKAWQFRSYDQAMNFARRLTMNSKVRKQQNDR